MNLNYSKPCANLAETRQGLPPGFNQVKCDNIELSELKKNKLLICCPTVLGFSLDKKLWGEFFLSILVYLFN
jgi:hypothetical protein